MRRAVDYRNGHESYGWLTDDEHGGGEGEVSFRVVILERTDTDIGEDLVALSLYFLQACEIRTCREANCEVMSSR